LIGFSHSQLEILTTKQKLLQQTTCDKNSVALILIEKSIRKVLKTFSLLASENPIALTSENCLLIKNYLKLPFSNLVEI